MRTAVTASALVILLVVLGHLAFWGGIAWVAWHFISKFW